MDLRVRPLAFVGQLPASKSILNRLLVVQSHDSQLQISGDSRCADVQTMRAAVRAFADGAEIPVGEAGTVLRFMALRVARQPGRYRLVGSPRLFARPQQELLKILWQLGAQAQLGVDHLDIESAGWRLQGDTLLVPMSRSSQFASAVLLNSWGLPFDLFVSLGGVKVSEGYWRLSQRLAQDLGMKIDFWDGDFRVPKEQVLRSHWCVAEMDLSSAFAVAAIAAVNGQASLTDFPSRSLQPDGEFVRVLAAMGVPITLLGTTLRVERAPRLTGVAVSLRSSPDLFPVLAALCALAHGDSWLYDAPHLVHKESNRLQVLAEWITQMGRSVETREDGLKITGAVPAVVGPLRLDAEGDHRLAFAAAVWKAAGHAIEILHPEAVDKSFPEFWQILGWQ